MEKVNGTDGAQKLTGRERGGSPSYFTHVPYLLPGTYPLGRVGLGQRTHPEPSQVTMSISAKPSPMSISPGGFLFKSCLKQSRRYGFRLVERAVVWRRRPHNTQLFTC